MTNLKALPHTTSAISSRMLDLAQNLQLDVDTVVGQQVAVFGLPGSGKTNFGALFCEQLGQFNVPLTIFDKEGDWTSIISALPRGIVATRENYPSGHDVLELGLQVVYDLSSWEDQELAAQVIMTTVDQMMEWAEARPTHERVPVLVVLDESARWLPQKRGTFLQEETYKALHTCFSSLSSTGRKRGLTPMYLNPKMSELSKDVLLPGIHVFFRATSHTDLDAYLEYIHSGDLSTRQLKNRIQAFTPGKAIVRLPSGAQKLVTFHRRKSEHVSHTPSVQAAINRYERIPFNPTVQFARTVAEEPITLVTPEQLPQQPATKEQGKRVTKRTTKRVKKPVSARERCKILLKKNPNMTPAELAAIIGCSKVTTTQYRRELGYEPAPRTPVQSVVKQRIVTLLSETPTIKLYDLARAAHCSYGEAKKYRTEIEQARHEEMIMQQLAARNRQKRKRDKMNSHEIHREQVLADPTKCYICEGNALPGVDEFGGHSCLECRERLAVGRLNHALQGDKGKAYSWRQPMRSDVARRW